MNLQECWDLINLSETTRKHCMILENCCYDWFEMNRSEEHTSELQSRI